MYLVAVGIAVSGMVVAGQGWQINVPNINPYDKLLTPPPRQRCAKKTDWTREYGYLPRIMLNSTYRFLENLDPKQTSQQNTVFSPLSILACMAPLIRGTDGETNRELVRSISLETDIRRDRQIQLRSTPGNPFRHQRLLQQLANSGPVTSLITRDLESVEYSLQTAIFMNQQLQFTRDYGYDMRKIMLSKAKRLDFSKKVASLKEINKFFDKGTNGKIAKLLNDLDPNAQMILASALYFKAPWKEAFNKYLTQKSDFNFVDGTSKKVDMMTLVDRQPRYFYTVLDGEIGDALQMPLGPKRCRTQFAVTFFRPKNAASIDDFQAYLVQNRVSPKALFHSKYPISISKIEVPKFKIEQEVNLVKLLGKLKVELAFDYTRGNFSSMVGAEASANFAVTSAVHKAIFEIDESGVEGAAASAFTISSRSAFFNMGQPDIEFILDRPFMFMVSELSTDLVLFYGRVNDPSS